ncbi:MAG: hypothetical protein ACK53L_03635, partial [Pirellulaceae bacterium]
IPWNASGTMGCVEILRRSFRGHDSQTVSPAGVCRNLRRSTRSIHRGTAARRSGSYRRLAGICFGCLRGWRGWRRMYPQV